MKLYFLSTTICLPFVPITIKEKKTIFIFVYVLRFFSLTSKCYPSGIFLFRISQKKKKGNRNAYQDRRQTAWEGHAKLRALPSGILHMLWRDKSLFLLLDNKSFKSSRVWISVLDILFTPNLLYWFTQILPLITNHQRNTFYYSIPLVCGSDKNLGSVKSTLWIYAIKFRE